MMNFLQRRAETERAKAAYFAERGIDPSAPRKHPPKRSYRFRRCRTQPSAPRPDTRPLLIRRPIPNTGGRSTDDRLGFYKYEYAPNDRPRPRELLGTKTDEHGVTTPVRRFVPKLAADSNGIPFLRLHKPQSPVLSRVIRQKGQKRERRTLLLLQLHREELDFAKEEDQWEHVVARQLKVVEQSKDVADTADYDYAKAYYREPPYAQSVRDGITYLQGKLNTELVDMLARSRAMLQLVHAEQAMADKEAEEDRKKAAGEEEGIEGTSVSEPSRPAAPPEPPHSAPPPALPAHPPPAPPSPPPPPTKTPKVRPKRKRLAFI